MGRLENAGTYIDGDRREGGGQACAANDEQERDEQRWKRRRKVKDASSRVLKMEVAAICMLRALPSRSQRRVTRLSVRGPGFMHAGL